VARLGGDEFAVLVRGLAHPTEAEIVAQRILDGLRAPFAVGGRAVHVQVSIGIACIGSRSIDADELLADADLAMYAAKAAGKGRAVTFTPNLRKAAVGQLALEEDLRYAATRGLFTLDYQPVIELASGAFIGGEALIRWPHPTRGMVPPLDFIPLAEDTGLVVPLGGWVLEQACAQGAAWRRMLGSDFTMNVNVSSRQIVEADFVGRVAAVLDRTQIEPHSVVLEMTESVFMADDAHSRRVMSSLRELGVRIAIDDFGTGYSSLAYLRRLPIDILKLDRSFVTDLADGASERVITSAVVEIAHQLGLMVIAEGIETTEQLELLVELGCVAGQGYLLHRPMPANAFTERLQSR
jgi:predicted signal transduction protein with EAL and GGDEF domain